MNNKILSFDIGGTSIKYGVVTDKGEILWKDEIATDAKKGGISVVNKVKNKIREIIENEDIIGIGISTAGIVDNKNGKILYASEAIPNYIGIDIKSEIEKEFGIKTVVENDVNCFGLAEIWLGNVKDKENIFCITIGTGVGGCAIINNKVLAGRGFSAGEIGYMKVMGEKLNISGSTSGLVNRVSARKGNIVGLNGKDIFILAEQGDKICIEEIERLAEAVAQGIINIIYVMNPEVIIIGGGIINQNNYLIPKIREKVNVMVEPYMSDNIEIKASYFRNDGGIIGATYKYIMERDG